MGKLALKHLLNVGKIRKQVYRTCGQLQAEFKPSDEPIPYHEIKNHTFSPIRVGQGWARNYGCAWFRFYGQVPAECAGKHTVLLIDIDGEGLVYNADGTYRTGLSRTDGVNERFPFGKKEVEIADDIKGGEKIDFLVDAGFYREQINPRLSGSLKRMDIVLVEDEIKAYFFDYFVLFRLLQNTADKNKAAQLDQLLSESYRLFKGTNESAKAARAVLKPAFLSGGGEKKYDIRATGHAHLDLAWLWPLRETRRKSVRTLTNALRYMEKYPDYVLGVSQPQQIAWAKDAHPALFEAFQQKTAEGRFELQGGMWVESDCNMPSGESLVRQSLYGQRFWKDEFGEQARVCWLPDTFGFPASLPQILKKSGMDYFMTIKISWNMHNTFPHTTFYWKGIDGTAVLAHMPPEGEYNSTGSPKSVYKAISKLKNGNRFLMPFGLGDGGGGPGEDHLEMLARQTDMPEYSIKKEKSVQLFEQLAEDGGFPEYQGELYLEKHQGTLTSQSKLKYLNRKTEVLLHGFEFLALQKFLSSGEYPHALLEQCWKEVLLQHFHDIMAGSSIKRVNREAEAALAGVYEKIQTARKNLLENDRKHLSVINPTSFARKEWIAYDDKWYFVEAEPYSAGKLEHKKVENAAFGYGKDYIENNRVKIAFHRDGSIKSYYDKTLGKEFTGKYLNKLWMHADRKSYFDAWDIRESYVRASKTVPILKSTKVTIDGPMLIRTHIFTHRRTAIKQNLVLLWDDPALRVDTKADWHEKHVMLRAEFAPSVYADEVRCDIQYGNMMRSTREDNSIEKAQFEVCAQKYVCLEKDGFGFALMNDCKYGHRIKNGKISLNLLRSPQYPELNADQGKHVFSYVIYPFAGTYEVSDVAERAYALNYPLIVSEDETEFASLLKTDCPGVIIETIKKAEDEDAVIVRLYENKGVPTKTALACGFAYQKAEETDMLERGGTTVDLANLSFDAYEIKTIKLTTAKE